MFCLERESCSRLRIEHNNRAVFTMRRKRSLERARGMTVSSAHHQFTASKILHMQRMAGLTGRDAATVVHCQGPVWAVLNGCFSRPNLIDAVPPYGRVEPSSPDAARSTNGRLKAFLELFPRDLRFIPVVTAILKSKLPTIHKMPLTRASRLRRSFVGRRSVTVRLRPDHR